MRAYERLVRYAEIHTSSCEKKGSTPSTERQRDLAAVLELEMRELGFEEVSVDSHAYVYGTLPATPGMEDRPAVALIAHLDTIPDEDFPVIIQSLQQAVQKPDLLFVVQMEQ